MQKTGSFKTRGAANKILQLRNVGKICTHSSGNHAQAVSYISQKLGIEAYIVMPAETPQVKKNAVRSYQAQIIETGSTQRELETMADRVMEEKKAEFIHPYDDPNIIAGAATCAL